jgi:hypothetical protein
MPVSTAPRARARRGRRRGGLAGDPLAGAVLASAVWPSSEAAIFMRTQGVAAHHAAEEADVQFARLGGAGADFHLDARCAQAGEALAGHQRIGIGSEATTRAMPAATSASQQGPVRPWWEQGSSVT